MATMPCALGPTTAFTGLTTAPPPLSTGGKAYVSLSYSFDFGRKKVEREKLDVQKGSSGIMRL